MTNPLKIIFAGTPEFSAVHLQALLQSSDVEVVAVLTQPDRPAGRGKKLQASAVKTLALSHQLPLYQLSTLRDESIQNVLRALEADLMVVVAYGLILPKSVLAIPRLGCINVHASLLPRFRGASPMQAAILAGDAETGVTIMQMDEGMDTGDMLLRVPCKIAPTDTTESLATRLATLGSESLIKTLKAFSTLKPEKQNQSQATYTKKITKADALIDWSKSAKVIDCEIRAFIPWPVAYTNLGEERIRIWEAKPLLKQHTFQPGQILSASTDGLDVATGEGVLRITKLQLPGGRILPVADVINSKRTLFQRVSRLG